MLAELGDAAPATAGPAEVEVFSVINMPGFERMPGEIPLLKTFSCQGSHEPRQHTLEGGTRTSGAVVYSCDVTSGQG